MRILHIDGGNFYGGVETMLLTIARLRHLTPTMQSSFAVCFDQRFATALRDAGIAPFVIGHARLRNFPSVARAQARLLEIISQERFDAVVCHMPWAFALFGSVVRKANIPLLLWMHGVGSQYHLLDRWARFTRPDHIICNSQYVAASARRLYPGTECSVSYPPVVLRAAMLNNDLKVALRRELDTPADAIVVVQASRIEPWKGHDVLLQALAVLRDVPKWICWIAGDAQNPAEARWFRKLHTIAAELNINERIRFLGHRSDISTLLHAADVYCQANSSPEPFGIAFVEALDAGIPVVTTAFNDGHEVVDPTCGVLVPSRQPGALAEALRRLFDNGSERKRLGNSGPRRARFLCDPDSQLHSLRTIFEGAVLPASAKSTRVAFSRPSTPRVVHLAPILFGEEIGGAERYTLELARSMARRVPTTLLTFGAKPHRSLLADGLEICVLPNWLNFGRLRFDPLNLSMLSELMNADVIHCHQPETMIATVALLYARAGRKLIFSTHLGGAGYGIHRIIDTKNWYNGHLHISDYSRRAFGHETLPHASVISGGVDTARFRPDPQAERTGEILYVGRLLPHKGINYLIEALDRSTRLTIVGRVFRHEQRFLVDLQRLAQGKQVTFVLNATDSALLEAYQRASCIVLPSVHRTIYGDYHPLPELLGQTLLEGMACGLPTICTNVTSLPELVEEGVTGFVVPPNEPSVLHDKIDWIQRHPRDAAAIGAAARKRVVEHFNWEMVVDRCLQAYGGVSKTANTVAKIEGFSSISPS